MTKFPQYFWCSNAIPSCLADYVLGKQHDPKMKKRTVDAPNDAGSFNNL